METERNIVCPICHKDDAIRKISSIVLTGTSSGSYSGPSVGITRVDGKWEPSGGYSILSGESSTTIAQLLSPPTEPSSPCTVACVWYIGLSTLLIIALIVIAMVMALIESTMDSGKDYLGIIILLLILGFFLWVYGFFKLLPKGAKKIESEVIDSREYSAWKEAMKRWVELYYCYRDDIVFDPDKNETCHPINIHEFISPKLSQKDIPES